MEVNQGWHGGLSMSILQIFDVHGKDSMIVGISTPLENSENRSVNFIKHLECS
jgi:hypothetical protein